MPATKPFGDLQAASILVIGHDPRLQKGKAEAEKAFFFEYLERFQTRPTYGPHARKYDLAHAVWEYVNKLAGRELPIDQLYITNLCNVFLPPLQGRGTVLIPDELAERGVKAIREIIKQGNFSLILPIRSAVGAGLLCWALLPEVYRCRMGPMPDTSFLGGCVRS